MKYQLKLSQLALIGILSTTLPACSWFSVYKIDIPQGTPISNDKFSQIKIGMGANEVLFLLGSPAVQDTLNPTRWDYIYDFTAGTVAKREKKSSVHNATQYVKIYFDQAGHVAKIEYPQSR